MPKKSPVSEDAIKWNTALALAQLRAMNDEAQGEVSPALLKLRLGNALEYLGMVAKELGVKDQARNGRTRPRSSAGLAQQPLLLAALCAMAAEDQELDDAESAQADENVRKIAAEYDEALKEALEEVVDQYPPENGATAEDLWDMNAPYLVLMTLNGHGIGIWDGDWDQFYEDTEKVEKLLKKRLGKFAEETGTGTLNEAFSEAAYNQLGDGADEDDDE